MYTDLQLTAASPIALSVLEFFNEAGVTIFSIYGSTENMGPGTVSLPGANVLGSVGRNIEEQKPGSTSHISNEPFGLGRFATDRCYAPQVNGRFAALLLTLSTM